MKQPAMTVTVEGSTELSLSLPPKEEFRQMTYAEAYLASCYAIWIAANDEEDERAIELKGHILGLTLQMLDEGETIH